MKIQWIVYISLCCGSIMASPNSPSFENFRQSYQTPRSAPLIKRHTYPRYYPSWMTSFMGYNLNLKTPNRPTPDLTQRD